MVDPGLVVGNRARDCIGSSVFGGAEELVAAEGFFTPCGVDATLAESLLARLVKGCEVKARYGHRLTLTLYAYLDVDEGDFLLST